MKFLFFSLCNKLNSILLDTFTSFTIRIFKKKNQMEENAHNLVWLL